MTDEQLAEELRALGRSAAVPPVADGLATTVLERVAELPVRRTFAQVVRSRWRTLLAALLVVLGLSALVEPVRATVHPNATFLELIGLRYLRPSRSDCAFAM
jgi:hypothetical protein